MSTWAEPRDRWRVQQIARTGLFHQRWPVEPPSLQVWGEVRLAFLILVLEGLGHA